VWYRYGYDVYDWRTGRKDKFDEADIGLDLYKVRRYLTGDTYQDEYTFVRAGSYPWSKPAEIFAKWRDDTLYRSMKLTLDYMHK
jgi:hypothetical protein